MLRALSVNNNTYLLLQQEQALQAAAEMRLRKQQRMLLSFCRRAFCLHLHRRVLVYKGYLNTCSAVTLRRTDACRENEEASSCFCVAGQCRQVPGVCETISICCMCGLLS